MDMIGKIRRMHSRDKKTHREIARTTGLWCNTVAKWLQESQPVEPKYRREAAKAAKATKLSAHEAELIQALKADANRPKKERRTPKALFAQIKAAGYEGGYSGVTDFIRKWRQGAGHGAATKAFVPQYSPLVPSWSPWCTLSMRMKPARPWGAGARRTPMVGALPPRVLVTVTRCAR